MSHARRTAAAAAALAAAALLTAAAPAAAGDVVVGAGLDDLYWRRAVAPAVLLEYRAEPRWQIWPVSLAIGGAFEADGDRDVWGGGGLVARLGLGDGRWRITASGMIGAYRQGAGSDLGRRVPIFRSQIEVSRAVAPRWRAGLAWSHKSNAYTRSPNPGVETLYLTLARSL